MTDARNRLPYNMGEEVLTYRDRIEHDGHTLTLTTRRVYIDPKTQEIVSEERFKYEKPKKRGKK